MSKIIPDNQWIDETHTMTIAFLKICSSDIRGDGNLACFTDKGKQITRAVFGEGPKDEAKLGAGVYKQYGKGRDGFDIVSNQFSIHYFFENKC